MRKLTRQEIRADDQFDLEDVQAHEDHWWWLYTYNINGAEEDWLDMGEYALNYDYEGWWGEEPTPRDFNPVQIAKLKAKGINIGQWIKDNLRGTPCIKK